MFKKSVILLSLLSSTVFAEIVDYDFEEGNLTAWQRNAQWEISEDKSSEVLSLIRESNGSAFNLCYTQDVNFTDGNISVLFRANKGKIDQGGGLMWRVQDNDNYYVARFNPLEDNFRFYIVEQGIRKEIASADVKLTGGWHSMKIIQKEEKFEGYLDEKKLLESEDKRLSQAGGVGVWTKADALTSFDNLVIEMGTK